MASTTPDYVFTRDYLDNNRMNLQHYQWIALFGYLLHPVIPTDRANLRIADVGTGTAVWLTELASCLPDTVKFEGLDVSMAAAPPAQWLPANVILRHWDIKEPVPSELLGAYDVVHVRNLAFVLRGSEVPAVLERLVSLLRPGGALQWGEPDVSSFRIETVTALRSLLTLSQPQDDRLRPTWVPQLPKLYRAAGLAAVEEDVRDAPSHLALAMHECNLPIHELVARKSKNKAVIEAVQDLMPQVKAETRQGACWAFTRWIVVGWKNSEDK
ncbi:uncharacterized protein TRUGW13939_04810 [Talaromyces rugulosus]|uniref:Methyltransferase domain-containing protein n=1 Tax=Talaromyces rugulosus TaxID=121627 RepID=A0A7H8QUK6_TALRU|nr:uncharacterized protein TRUGW13939_04810 [Talaromyces rugulosus]QKX57692.1 hypothetical protein TRUGW13939_04810 [Talaromyces rugulosus]